MPLQDTLIFMWFGVAPKNGYQKDKCFKEIGLLAQNMTIILGSYLANIIFFWGGVYMSMSTFTLIINKIIMQAPKKQ